mmetsp:Transcript_8288/g.12356  ORF Transcript_8288/g.12356 Transcript_8288/m.12356 type:complete len:443 (+) Transcript_8288:240-1568(+)
MVVRNCYIAFANKVLDDTTRISLILGMKGIGLTVFINYLIVRIIEKYCALNESIPDIVYTYEMDKIRRVRFSVCGVSSLSTSSPAPYYLSDSVDIADSSLGTKLLLEVTSYEACNYRNFIDRMTEKSKFAVEYDMPAWSIDELLLVNPLSDTFSMADANFLFNVFGGCVKYFIPREQPYRYGEDYIQENAEWFFGTEFQKNSPIVWNWTMEKIRTTIENVISFGVASSSDSMKHALICLFLNRHISIENTYTYIIGYTSRFMRFLAGCLKGSVEDILWNWLKDIFSKSGEGLAFESLGHKTLVATKQSYVASNVKKRVRTNKTFEKSFYQMPRVLLQTVDDIETLLDDQYGLPLFCNFTIVDVVIQPNILLQFTIEKTPGNPSDEAKYEIMRSKLRGGRETHKLIFVLQPENLKEFKPSGIPVDLSCFKMTYMMLPSKKRRL